MKQSRPRGFSLRPQSPACPKISAIDAAERLGLSVAQLEELARSWWLEPTYSLEEVAQHFGCSKCQALRLVQLGSRFGAKLDPARGGLYPTFKPSHKSRRIPLSAIERHKQHMARAHDGAAA